MLNDFYGAAAVFSSDAAIDTTPDGGQTDDNDGVGDTAMPVVVDNSDESSSSLGSGDGRSVCAPCAAGMTDTDAVNVWFVSAHRAPSPCCRVVTCVCVASVATSCASGRQKRPPCGRSVCRCSTNRCPICRGVAIALLRVELHGGTTRLDVGNESSESSESGDIALRAKKRANKRHKVSGAAVAGQQEDAPLLDFTHDDE